MNKLLERCKKYIKDNPSVKMAAGIVLIVLGFLALVTPLTPGSWLMLVGLEFLGIRFVFTDRIMKWVRGKKTA